MPSSDIQLPTPILSQDTIAVRIGSSVIAVGGSDIGGSISFDAPAGSQQYATSDNYHGGEKD
jgi:hypothetical protein